MNLTSVKVLKNILKQYQLRPLKRLGQNFLIDKGAIKKVIKATDLSPKDIVLEIGPGLGALTQELAKKAKRVIAIEKDPKMIEILKKTLKGFNNIEVIQGDILKMANDEIRMTNYKVVSNLPFYLTSPVIHQFLEMVETKFQPFEMVLVVQKEVGQRICARPPRMSILAVSIQIYAQPKIISYLSKKSFWPQPKVDSAIIKLEVKKEKLKIDRELFLKIIKAGFSQPRKQLTNNLSKKLKLNRVKVGNWLLENNIKPTQRAETLSVEDWINFTKNVRI